jgi:outer membrane lipoprotein-sorting protein
MYARPTARLALFAAVGATLAWGAAAQERKTVPANPVGVGGNWSQTITKEGGVAGQEFDKKQIELINKVSAYFNAMTDVKGSFVQTTAADSKRMRGKFYFSRPGRFRFDYSLPSRQIVMSDGQYLVIQDHDLNTDDRVSLDRTAFRVLLRENVDLLRDAQILEVGEEKDRIVLTLQDKNPETQGRIKLLLVKQPALELREWITHDQQGVETRVQLVELVKTEDLDSAMFKPPQVFLRKLQ